MASQLSKFHLLLTQEVPDAEHFAFDKETSVSDVYNWYAMKHERTPVSLFMDKMFSENLRGMARSPADFSALYVKCKTVAHFAHNAFEKL